MLTLDGTEIKLWSDGMMVMSEKLVLFTAYSVYCLIVIGITLLADQSASQVMLATTKHGIKCAISKTWILLIWQAFKSQEIL